MAIDINFFRGATGLNNKIDPTRIGGGDPDHPAQLATAYNVDIDDSGKVSRAASFTLSLALANAKNFYFNGEHGFINADGNLYYVFPNLTTQLIGTGLNPDARTRWETVNNVDYFVDGHSIGQVSGMTAGEWVAEGYVGPTSFKSLSSPPVGHLVRYFSSRMYIGADKALWHSEPFSFSQFDTARAYLAFDSRLRMIQSVSDGLYVSTERCVYFLQGRNPSEFVQFKVHDYPAIEGTDIYVPGGSVLDGAETGKIAVWTSTKSVCAGFPGGRVVEITEKSLVYPPGQYGSAAFVNGSYVVLIEE